VLVIKQVLFFGTSNFVHIPTDNTISIWTDQNIYILYYNGFNTHDISLVYLTENTNQTVYEIYIGTQTVSPRDIVTVRLVKIVINSSSE